jgi:hypothetical protein
MGGAGGARGRTAEAPVRRESRSHPPAAPAPSDGGRIARTAGREWPPNPRAAVRWTRPARPVVEASLLVFLGVPLAWLRGRVRLRVLLGLGAAGLAAVLFLVPLAWAGRLDPCAAAEVALVDKAIGLDSGFAASRVRVANWTGADGRLLSHGRVGREIAAKEYAGWPPAAGCTALFWRARWEVASLGGFTAVLSRALSARR